MRTVGPSSPPFGIKGRAGAPGFGINSHANEFPMDLSGRRGAQTRSGTTPERRAPVSRTLSLIPFVLLVLGGGLVIGFLTTPGEWYGQLAKPAFNPPGWIFGPVWTVLYVIIAVAGWRIWQLDRGGWPMKLWWAQLVLNFLWTPVFFGAHQISLALVVILLLLAAILAFIATAWRRERVAAWLFAPYAAWVAFASVLNASIFALN